MTDQAFETRLRAGIGRYAEGGIRPIDAHAIAVATVATGGARGVGGRPWDRWIGRVRVTPRLILITALVLLAVAIAVTAVGLATKRPPQLTDRAQPTTPPMTSARPAPSAPAEAPSMERIAYVQDGDIYVAAGDGSSPVKVLDDPGIAFTDVRWLSDGRHVVVGAVGVATVVDLTTGDRRRLDIPRDSITAWRAGTDEVAAIIGEAPDLPATLRIIDALTGALRDLPPVPGLYGLAWSTDGTRLGGQVGSDFVWIDPAAGSSTVVATAAGDPEQVAWSPDLTRVAFVMASDTGCDGVADKTCPSAANVFVVEAAPSGEAAPTKVAGPLPQDQPDGNNHSTPLGPPPAPAWSPDGTWVAYRTEAGLTVAHPDGSADRELPIGHVASFMWDADGAGITAIVSGEIDGTNGDATHVDLATGSTRPSGIAGISLISPTSVGPRIDHTVDTGPAPSVSVPAAAPTTTPSAAPAAPPTSHRLLVATYHRGQCGFRATEIDLDTGADRTIGTCGVSVAADGRHLVDDHDAIDLMTGMSTPISGRHEPSPGGRWMITPPVLGRADEMQAAAGTPWEVATWDGHVVARLPRPWVKPAYGPLWPQWSADEMMVSIATETGSIDVDLATGEQTVAPRKRPTGPPAVASPDGERIAFIRDGDAWIANPDGSDERNVSQFSFGGADDVWLLPDDTAAVLQGQVVWIIGPGSDRRSIDLGPISEPYHGRSIAWSPDHRWFASILGNEDDDRVLSHTRFYAVDGTLLGDVEGGDIAWSPDGQHAAVSVNPWDLKPNHTTAPKPSPPGRLALVGADGRTIDVAKAWGAVWSPDSTRLVVFTSAKKGAPTYLDLLAADGTDRHTIATEHIGAVTWIPDR